MGGYFANKHCSFFFFGKILNNNTKVTQHWDRLTSSLEISYFLPFSNKWVTRKKNDPTIRNGQQFLISFLRLPFTISSAELICSFTENHLPPPTPDNTNQSSATQFCHYDPWCRQVCNLDPNKKNHISTQNTICCCLHHLHKASPIPLHHCLAVILHKYKTIKQSKPPFRYWQGLTLPHVTHLFKNLRK